LQLLDHVILPKYSNTAVLNIQLEHDCAGLQCNHRTVFKLVRPSPLSCNKLIKFSKKIFTNIAVFTKFANIFFHKQFPLYGILVEEFTIDLKTLLSLVMLNQYCLDVTKKFQIGKTLWDKKSFMIPVYSTIHSSTVLHDIAKIFCTMITYVVEHVCLIQNDE